ncbi:S-layer homology domain-containing protein [Paenibacillus tuaregi]|uniref:S-layer homology domain-containing protein n=1 Tax=Paenibacillus tuaregi TaxID=1816681 RepID=UPI000837ADA5|nr:S-layer homology domain-containing protein [Paenibacillus tuaregi]
MSKKLAVALFASVVTLSGAFGVTARAAAEGTAAFKDSLPAWAKSDIEYVAAKGYMKGDTNSKFNPNATISRAEFAAILARASNNTEDKGETGFSSIPGWSQNEVNTAVSKGFILPSDYPNGFNPDTPLTRRELAKWVSSGLAAKDEDFKKALSDTADTLVPVAEYYKGGLNKEDYPYVSVAMGTHLMTGYPDGRFAPNQTTTRAEAAVILRRFESIQDKKPDAFQDLKEFREVGLTGTNVISMGYKYGVDLDGIEANFSRIRNQPYKLRSNVGSIRLNHFIIANANDLGNIKNLYGKMFLDQNYEYRSHINEKNYQVFVEASLNSNVANMDADTYLNASSKEYLQLPGFKSGTISKYGLTVLPDYGMISKEHFFKKGIEKTYWTVSTINKFYVDEIVDNGANIGINGKTFSFYIPK